MLPKINRLTKKKDFDSIFKKGKSLKIDFLVFKILKNDLKESRFGFVVSKTISKKAVIRNKVKRRLREAVFKGLKNQVTGASKSSDVVIITLPGIEKREFLQIQEVITKFLSKL